MDRVTSHDRDTGSVRSSAASPNRAGSYQSQPEGYRAFIPKALPPSPPLRLDGDIQALLSQASHALGGLDGSIHTLPNSDLFLYMYVRKEAVLSSRIEGTVSSLLDSLNAEAQIASDKAPKDAGDVVNYVNAMNYGLDTLANSIISVATIKGVHKCLLEHTRGENLRPGEIRQEQNWIGPPGCTPKNAMFVPPPPSLVGKCLDELICYTQHDDGLPPIIRIALIHAQFETIRPFSDGNGRVGCLLITLFLHQQGLLRKPVLYLASFFNRYRREYHTRLQAVRDAGDWESWLSYFLRGVTEASIEATDAVRKLLMMRESHRWIVNENFGQAAKNGHLVLERLYDQPTISVRDIQNITGTSYKSSSQLLARFTDAKILIEGTGYQRNRRYYYSAYIDLFGNEPDGTHI